MGLRLAAFAALPLFALSPVDDTEDPVKLPTGNQNLPISDGDRFGWSISSQGGRLAVGAPLVNNGKGAVFLFLHNGTEWVYRGRLAPTELEEGDRFGYSVDFDGNVLVAGAPTITSDEGATYVYTFRSSGWSYTTLSTSATPTQFGYSVSIDDDVIAASAVGSQEVYVYRDTATGWVEEDRVDVVDQDNVSFGEAVAIQGDTLVIGDDRYPIPSPYRPGIAYVFRRDGTDWDLDTTLENPEPVGQDAPHFGEAVAIDGAWVLVGAPQHTKGADSRTGTAWAYKFNASGQIVVDEHELERTSAENSHDNFGNALTIAGSTLLVGAPGKDGTVGNAGAGYQFDLDTGGTSWSEIAEFLADDEEEDDKLGRSVALGSFAIFGAPQTLLNNPGAVYVWEVCD